MTDETTTTARDSSDPDTTEAPRRTRRIVRSQRDAPAEQGERASEGKAVIRRRRRSRTAGQAARGDADRDSDRADAGGQADGPEAAGQDERAGQPERPAAGGQTERADAGGQAERADAGGQAERADAGGQAERAEQDERAGQPERPDAGGQAERPDARGEAERSDGRNQAEAADAGGQTGADADRPAEANETADQQRRPTRERRRSRRGGRSESVGEPAATGAPPETDDSGAKDGGKSGSAPQPTRLQTRTRRGRGRGRPRRGRKPVAEVTEETRRAIAEGPPRRMLVQVGEDRTQIAVLEERSLVEHYVTRKADVSYVGNIYLGRVQNVLPGMEAAFVDIGKGRNGVLYAGEVDYEEADLEGDIPRIEQTLKPGQAVLVQVTKDPMGTKGARLTQHLSVAGRYCVLAPGDGMLGISRKLSDDERERLRQLLKELKPEGFGLIVRTAAEGVTREQLEADIARLTRIWGQVQEKATSVKPLEPVYEEPNLVMRVIRDVFGTEYSGLVIDDAELAEEIRGYLRDVAPDMADKVDVYEGESRIFDAYEVTTQVRRALEKKVWLKSGGYLIIEKTEAMWVVDVNTGKFVGEDNLEETVLRNNLEAAEEIARQLRLRDMGGIIVIDFVDMLVPANRDEVLKRFKRELARDKTKSRVMDISRLGLVQMTRKNVSQGVFENFTTRCETCEGRGARILDEAFR